MQTTVQLNNVESLAEMEPKYAPVIERWLAGDIVETDADIMMEIVETYIADELIVWPPAVYIEIDNGVITLSANAHKITAQA